MKGLISYPSEDYSITNATSASWGSPNADTNYAASKGIDGIAGTATKSAGASDTYTVSGPSATIVGVALFWSNATAVSVNGNALTVPSRASDGYIIAPFKEGLSITASSFAVVMSKSGSAPLQFSHLALIKAFHEWPILNGVNQEIRRPGDVVIVTRLGYQLDWPAEGIRYDAFDGTFQSATQIGELQELEAQSNGSLLSDGSRKPFVFVENREVNYARLCKFDGPLRITSVEGAVKSAGFKIREVVYGTPPSAS